MHENNMERDLHGFSTKYLNLKLEKYYVPAFVPQHLLQRATGTSSANLVGEIFSLAVLVSVFCSFSVRPGQGGN